MPKKKSAKPVVITLLLILLLLVAAIIAAFALYTINLRPANHTDTTPRTFTVNSGQGVSSIARQLKSQGLIQNELVFKFYVSRSGLAPKLQAGEFELSPSMSVPELSNALTKAFAKEIRVTILEGWRVEEVAEHLTREFTTAGLPFNQAVFLSQPEIREGYVFPDTYNFTLSANEMVVAKTIEANFNRRLSPLQTALNQSGKTLNEILTMASIIEREAREDRQIVSGILWKRLDNDWPLQVDATLQYIKGKNTRTGEWWDPPLAVDKNLDSLYNTYQHPGLPPAPIGNPSLSAIEAALTPQNSPYWYYITGNDGHMYYGATLDEHNSNINRYLR